LHICDDKEAKLKEESVSLKIKSGESKRVEEGMRKKYQYKVEEVERL